MTNNDCCSWSQLVVFTFSGNIHDWYHAYHNRCPKSFKLFNIWILSVLSMQSSSWFVRLPLVYNAYRSFYKSESIIGALFWMTNGRKCRSGNVTAMELDNTMKWNVHWMLILSEQMSPNELSKSLGDCIYVWTRNFYNLAHSCKCVDHCSHEKRFSEISWYSKRWLLGIGVVE